MKKTASCILLHTSQATLTFIILAVSCVSIATTNWRQSKDGSDLSHHLIVSGLWKTCNASIEADSYECFVGEDSVGMQSWLKMCRMGAVLRLVCGLLTLVFSVLFSRQPTRYKGYTITGLQLVGSLVFTLTLVLYAVEFNDQTNHKLTGKTAFVASYDLGWSYMLGWVSVFLSIVNVVLTIVVFQSALKRRKVEEKRFSDAKRLMKKNCYYLNAEEDEGVQTNPSYPI